VSVYQTMAGDCFRGKGVVAQFMLEA